MWVFDFTLLEIILRTAVVYVVVLIGLRLTGKREVGQMTPFDLVVLLLLSNAVQNAMTGPDSSITGGIVAACTLLLLNTLIARFAGKDKKFRNLVQGTPTILIRHGKLISENLALERLSVDEVMQALREHGVSRIEDVYSAILEIDGSISVIKQDDLSTVEKAIHRVRFVRHK
jgi:uncharacterized membrane protein YcaP (DUF421 family)